MQHPVMPGSSSQHSGGATPSRVRVWSDELQKSAWVLLPRSAVTVSEVATSIADKLGLAKTEYAHDIFMDDALVLPSEDARLIRDGDVVAIENKRPFVEGAQVPRKKIKMFAASDPVIPVQQRPQMQLPIPVNPQNGLAVSPQVKLPKPVPEDISGSEKNRGMSFKTLDEEFTNTVPKSAGTNPRISPPLKRAESTPAPALSYADLNLKRPFQEDPSPEKSRAAADPSSKMISGLMKETMLATESPVRTGPSTQKKVDFQLGFAARKKPQLAVRPPKLPSPSARGNPATQGSTISPASSPGLKKSVFEASSPALSSLQQKAPFESAPSASSSGQKKPIVDPALLASSPGHKKLLFEPSPAKENSVMQKDALHGREPSHSSLAEEVGGSVFSKKESTIIEGTPAYSKRAEEGTRPVNMEISAQETKKMSWQRPSKPTNVYTAGRIQPADRSRNESRAQRGYTNSTPGNDRNTDKDDLVDRDRHTGRSFNSGRNRRYHVGKNYNTSKDYNADRGRRLKALQESQHNESFFVGLSSNPKKMPVLDVPPTAKSKIANKEKPVSDEADDAAVEETKKDLMELFGKSKSEKFAGPPTVHGDRRVKAPDNATTKAPHAVCENHVSAGSCTILDMLRSGPPGDNDETGVYCRVQVLLGFGNLQKPTHEPSKWISLMLATRPTQTNDLRISKINAEALDVLRRAGRAARQRSPGTNFDCRGANLKEDLPILLNPNAIHKFSFDIRSHDLGDSLRPQAEVEEIGDAHGLWKNEVLQNESPKPASPAAGVHEPEVKTGYENLRSRFDKPASENAPPALSLDQLPIIDELPGGAADVGAGLDVTDYPPLDDVDSVLDTLNGIELDHVAGDTSPVHEAQAQQPGKQGKTEDSQSVKPKIALIPRNFPAPDGSDGVGPVPGLSCVQASTSPPRNVLSPDSVIDLIEEPREVDCTKRRENATFLSDYRNFMLNVMMDVTTALKTLTQRDDLHLRRFSATTSLS